MKKSGARTGPTTLRAQLPQLNRAQVVVPGAGFVALIPPPLLHVKLAKVVILAPPPLLRVELAKVLTLAPPPLLRVELAEVVALALPPLLRVELAEVLTLAPLPLLRVEPAEVVALAPLLLLPVELAASAVLNTQRSKEQRDTESRQQFLTPRPDVLPASLTTDRVPWTSKIPPHHMLGTNCKALDPIRMQHSCWITCERVGDHFVFKLEGESEQEVRSAAQRVGHIHAQAEAKRFQAETLHIMDVADDSALPRVRLQEYFDTSGESLGKLPNFVIPSNPVTFFENTGSDAIQSFLEHIEPMISESRSYHSYVRLDIRLGTFVMTTYPRGASEFDYANFHDIMDEDTMEAFVTDEIGDPKIESTLLQRVSQATHLLVVQNPESKRMIYAATLEFDDPGRRGQLMVDIELSYEAGSTGVSSSRWYRTESCREDVRRLVDVNMVNLSRGFAWHLEMTAANPVDKSTLPKQYDHFIKSLSINPESQSFLVVPPQDRRGAAIPLLSVSQKRIWRFETGFGYWAVDVVEGYGTYHVGGMMTREDPKWSLNVFNTKHQSDFESNAQVKIGERAAWGESEDPVVGLFPPGWQPQSTGDPMGNSVPDTDRSKGLSQLLRLLHGLYDAIVDERASS
ncbi:hypothetical protein IWZ03DRAFT_418097 [Phyllosticta citriasiana]|uniref:DUF7905 domain-containing protein n=1 Tax=Phyllosticta citriasiana TaxID=595635 RepID=A0ABR1KHD8_9PEZI